METAAPGGASKRADAGTPESVGLGGTGNSFILRFLGAALEMRCRGIPKGDSSVVRAGGRRGREWPCDCIVTGATGLIEVLD
jgi:hypothetical protein